MTEFKRIRFFDGLEEVSPETAAKDKYFEKSYMLAKVAYHGIIDKINDSGAWLILNNSNRDDLFHLDNTTPELDKLIEERTTRK